MQWVVGIITSLLTGGLGAWWGLKHWKLQKRIELKANAAAQAIAASSEVSDRLRRIAAREDPFPHEGSGGDQEYYEFWQEIIADQGTRARFTSARVQVETYVPEALGAFDQVWQLMIEADTTLDDSIAKCKCDRNGCLNADDAAILHDVAGPKMRDRVDAAHAELTKLLRPVAQYQSA